MLNNPLTILRNELRNRKIDVVCGFNTLIYYCLVEKKPEPYILLNKEPAFTLTGQNTKHNANN